MQKNLKKAALGVSSFQTIQSTEAVYVDKTRFIEALEQSNVLYPFIVRPRRFGKSLFVNILEQYYDKAASADFEKNFKGTYIYEHKTPLQGTYHVLRLEFSGLAAEYVETEFLEVLKNSASEFFFRYPMIGSDELLKNTYTSPAAFIKKFFAFVASYIPRQKLFIVIDEYDQFANEILSTDKKTFRKTASTKGFLKNFYTAVKAGTSGVVGRVFITRVTSISLDSLTSGFSIATNLTFDADFSEMFGFSDSEVRALIPQMVDLARYGHSETEVFTRMKDLYDGYHMSAESPSSVFNSSAVLYYLDYLGRHNSEPDTLMDSSFAVDLSKIHGILSLAPSQMQIEIVRSALDDVPVKLGALKKVINFNQNDTFDRNDLLSTLVYFGFLTFVPGKRWELVCPNKVIKEQFFQYYFSYLLEAPSYAPVFDDLNETFSHLRAGDPLPFLTYTCETLSEAMGVHDSAHFSEHSVQVAVLSNLLFFSDYRATSEFEVRTRDEKGYADLAVLPKENPEKNGACLIEIKHIAKGSARSKKAREAAVAGAAAKARGQLALYAGDKRFAGYPLLKKVVIVFVGTSPALIEVC